MFGVRDDRAVSTAVNYVLLLGIVTLLVAVLLVGTANVVEGEQEQAVRAGLAVVGNDLAAELESTSTLAESVGTTGSVVRQVDLPNDVAGATYTVGIRSEGGDNYVLTLSTVAPSQTVEVPFSSNVAVTERTIDGGDVRIAYTAGGDIEVTNE